MNTIKAIRTNNNDDSHSKAKDFIGIPIIGPNGELLNGIQELSLSNDENKTLCRFVNGFLDGNVYDENGNIIETLPALEYENGGTEYWTKGHPDGLPAIKQNFSYYEEDWINGVIQEIREEQMLVEIE